MKIYPEKLSQHLSAGLSPAYLLTGDETLLINEAQALIFSTAKKQGFEERKIYHDMSTQDWQILANDYQALSLFSQKEIIDIRFSNAKFSETAKQVLKILLESPNPDKLLILSLPKIETATTRTKWFKALEANTTFIQYWPITKENFPRWLNARASKLGLSLSPTGLNTLATYTEGNLLAAQQVIHRLHLIYGKKQIDEQQVMHVVSDHSQTDLYQLIDDILIANGQRISHAIHNLAAQGTDPILVLWLLNKELHAYLSLLNAKRLNQDLATVYQSLQIWPKKQNAYRVIFKRHSIQQLTLLLQNTYQIDLMIKGIHTQNVWDALLQLAFALAGINYLSGVKP